MTDLREPLDVAPFLAWCDRREQQIRRELDAWPAIGVRQNISVQDRLVAELGWDISPGIRRLHRWRREVTHVERATVEEALFHAGADFETLYPDLEPKGPGDRLGQGRLMTNDELRAAHVIYLRAQLSLRQLGDLLWERYGYANAASCASQIQRGFANLGLPRRTPTEGQHLTHMTHGLTVGGKVAPLYKRHVKLGRHGQCSADRKDGERCPRAAQPGGDVCGYHQPDEIARRRAQIAAVNAQRARADRTAAA